MSRPGPPPGPEAETVSPPGPPPGPEAETVSPGNATAPNIFHVLMCPRPNVDRLEQLLPHAMLFKFQSLLVPRQLLLLRWRGNSP